MMTNNKSKLAEYQIMVPTKRTDLIEMLLVVKYVAIKRLQKNVGPEAGS